MGVHNPSSLPGIVHMPNKHCGCTVQCVHALSVPPPTVNQPGRTLRVVLHLPHPSTALLILTLKLLLQLLIWPCVCVCCRAGAECWLWLLPLRTRLGRDTVEALCYINRLNTCRAGK